MRLGIRDQKVLAAFAERRPAEGDKLSTDGRRLDGHWLGGSRLAYWERDQIHTPDRGSRTADSIQKQLRRHAAPVQFADYKPSYKTSYGSRRRDPERGTGLRAPDVVQLRFEPGTGGVVLRADGGGYFQVQTPGRVRRLHWTALRKARPEHAERIRRATFGRDPESGRARAIREMKAVNRVMKSKHGTGKEWFKGVGTDVKRPRRGWYVNIYDRHGGNFATHWAADKDEARRVARRYRAEGHKKVEIVPERPRIKSKAAGVRARKRYVRQLGRYYEGQFGERPEEARQRAKEVLGYGRARDPRNKG